MSTTQFGCIVLMLRLFSRTSSRSRRSMIRLPVCVLITLITSMAPAVPAAQAVKSDAEHVRLAAMAGIWDVEVTFWLRPAGPGVTTTGVSTIQTLFGGLFIEERIEGTLNGRPFTTLAWTGFNTAIRRYEATRIASTNTIRI